MKAELLLTIRYLIKHKKQFFASVVCIAFFAAAIGAVQLFRLSSDNSTSEERLSVIGRLGGYAVNVNPKLVTKEELEKNDAGAVYITGEVETDYSTATTITYIGYMDNKAKDLQKLILKKGDYPKTANEAAMAESQVKALQLKGDIGEKFTLDIVKNGKSEKQAFTLTGITQEYAYNDSYWIMPQVLTGSVNAPNTYLQVNIAYGIDLNKEKGNTFEAESFAGSLFNDENISLNEQIVNANMQRTSTIMTSFFILLVLLGVFTVVKITFQDRRRYICLMRCVGMTKGQGAVSLILQGITVALFSALLCMPFSIGFAWLAAYIMRTFGGYPFFVLIVQPQPVILSAIICACVVITAFIIQSVTLLQANVLSYNTEINKNNKRRNWKSTRSFIKLWSSAEKRGSRIQNGLSIALIAGCIAILIFGTFSANFSALEKYCYDSERTEELGCDYEFLMLQGAEIPDYLCINIPRESGVTAKNIDLIKNTEGLSIGTYAVDNMCTAWILSPGCANEEILSRYAENGYLYSQMPGQDKSKMRKHLTYAGYKSNEDLIQHRFIGLSYDQVINSSKAMKSSNINKEAFNSGKQVVAFGNKVKAGDKFTVSVPIYNPNDMYKKEQAKPVIHNIDVEVAAVCNRESIENPTLKDLISPNYDCIVISDEYLMNIDNRLRYDYVSVNYTGDRSDMELIKNTEDVLTTINYQSSSVELQNYINLSSKWDEVVREVQLPTMVLVGLFLCIILLALTLSNSVKIKSRVKSYSLMRAIGLNKKQLLKTSFYSSFKICMTGTVIGIVIGYALSGFIKAQYFWYPVTSNLVMAMIVATLIGIILITLIALLSCLGPVKWIMKKNITDSIESIQY